MVTIIVRHEESLMGIEQMSNRRKACMLSGDNTLIWNVAEGLIARYVTPKTHTLEGIAENCWVFNLAQKLGYYFLLTLTLSKMAPF